jgi:hypothetical protein
MGKVEAKTINHGNFEPIIITVYKSVRSWDLGCQTLLGIRIVVLRDITAERTDNRIATTIAHS